MNAPALSQPIEAAKPNVDAYTAFLRRKIPQAEAAGFEPPSAPHAALSAHARDIADWAIRGGRRAIFANFGLHKTRMNIQLAKWVVEHTGGKYLIVAPLGVRQEFTKSDGPAMDCPMEFARTTEEAFASPCSVIITNYDSVVDGKMDVSRFAGAGLDEFAKALEKIGKLPATFMLFPPVSRNKDVWTDIHRMQTLNAEQSRRNMEMHVCPLQLGIIKRLITRYSNPGEIVFDPFLGIGSVAYQAIKMGRIGWGVELNLDYWKCAVHYSELAEAEISVPTLFDLPPIDAAA